jgi:hypothetical protein
MATAPRVNGPTSTTSRRSPRIVAAATDHDQGVTSKPKKKSPSKRKRQILKTAAKVAGAELGIDATHESYRVFIKAYVAGARTFATNKSTNTAGTSEQPTAPANEPCADGSRAPPNPEAPDGAAPP